MKTKLFLAAIVFAANCTIANAQVLGGNAVGGIGGSLGGGVGGMRDIGTTGHGAGNGAFGANVDAGSLRRTTGDIAGRTSSRTRSTLDTTRQRTRSSVNTASDVGHNAVATTRHQAAAAAGTAKSGAAWGAHSAIDAGQGAIATANGAKGTVDVAGDMASNVNLDGAASTPNEASTPSPVLNGAVDKGAGAELMHDSERLPITASGDAGASGTASASKKGVRTSGSANGSGGVTLGN